jgi:hypothetical protein
MSTESGEKTIDEQLAALEDSCAQIAREMSTSRNVRETIELADSVSVPHHLKEFAREKVHSLSRLPRACDRRVEEVVTQQLLALNLERNESTASRDYDRMKASDWPFMRSSHPDLYNKSVREGALIIDRKRKAALVRSK